MIKRVECIDSRYYEHIKEGEIYDVVTEGDRVYLIITDSFAKNWYEKECFKEIEHGGNDEENEEEITWKECFREVEHEHEDNDNDEWEEYDEYDEYDKYEELEATINELKSRLGMKNLQYNELSYKYEEFKKDIIMKLCEDENRLDIIKFIMER